MRSSPVDPETFEALHEICAGEMNYFDRLPVSIKEFLREHGRSFASREVLMLYQLMGEHKCLERLKSLATMEKPREDD